jgi:hypothetical protein
VPIKIYRYRIQPERIDRFLEIQKRADWLYRKHLNYKINHCQCRTDPAQWIEMHWYPDEAALNAVDALAAQEPELARQFHDFLEVLDPADPKIHEELLDDRSIR